MRAGRMRHRITIEGNTAPVDDPIYGPQPGGWGVIADRIAAEVQDVLPSRDEATREGVVIGTRRTRVRFRWRAGIDTTMRIIVHGAEGRTLQIVGGPAVLGNREGIEVMCEAYSTQGA